MGHAEPAESGSGPAFPPAVQHTIPGWTLFWADLEPSSPDASLDSALATLCRGCEAAARTAHTLEGLGAHPTASAVRKLFRRAGTDPTRYRPSSEALLRRVLKGDELPAIHALVDLNNCLSMQLVVPACVVDVSTVSPPFELRAGGPGEAMQSLRGPFDLQGKPLLADRHGPFGTPITDSERVKVQAGIRRAWLVAYLPEGGLDSATAGAALTALLARAPVAVLRGCASTG
jgi:DNA/RNA-binding domain of Phe-tRNA-synthetase-like protein